MNKQSGSTAPGRKPTAPIDVYKHDNIVCNNPCSLYKKKVHNLISCIYCQSDGSCYFITNKD